VIVPHPSSNPFTPNEPIVEEERFFGREDVCEWIADCFYEHRRFLLVYGTPRVGKTSLLLRLRTRLAGKGLPVYVDLGALPQAPARDLLWSVIVEIHRQLGEQREPLPAPAHEAFHSQAAYLHDDLLPAWREGLRGRPLILLLDGVDLARFREGSWAELVLRLQEIVAQEADLQVVMTVRGSSTGLKEPVPALRGLPQWDLDYLIEAQTEELLVGLARYQLGFDYDALRRIHLLTGGHPYLVQLYGAELYRHLAPYGQVTIHAVSDLVPTVVERAAGAFGREWDGLSRDAQITLAAVGAMHGYRGTATPWDIVLLLRRAGANRGVELVEQGLQELCDRRIMRWYGASSYALRLELWRPWSADAHPLPDVLHGKRPRRKEQRTALPRGPAINWGGLLPWLGIGLVILLVAKVWSSRSSSPGVVLLPTLTLPPATPRPTATRVPVPGRIAYMAQAGPYGPWCIWTMRDNGTDPMRLTDGTSDDTMPAWSPDGRKLAFTSNRSGNRDVWVMDADGTNLQNITQSPADEWTPAWSPDGMDIAFASHRDGNWEIHIAKPDGSQVRRLTNHPAPDYAPSWSPDGSRLAFVSERDGNAEIYTVNRDGTDLRRLTENQVTDLYPQWSPDGTLIAFESYRDGNMEIYVMEADGSNPRNLTNDPDSEEHQPSWSPDGRWITYYSNRDSSWDVFIMAADGSQKVNLTMSPASEQSPTWQPRRD
jgi:Tol biopolymer transport system component